MHKLDKHNVLGTDSNFLDGKPDIRTNLPEISFDKTKGREDKNHMYQKLDGTMGTLFPSSLSHNKKTHFNIDFSKVPGRNEHGSNLNAR